MAIRRFRGRLGGVRDDEPARRRLFGFPYAGAGGAVFRLWPDRLPADVEMCVPCLPGRDARVDEPPDADADSLAPALAREMLALTDRPYALFGHSMGAFVAFEVAHELTGLGRPPSHLFVSAQRGPRVPHPASPISALPDESFLSALRARFDNIPVPVLQNRELMRILLRALRADFALAENYRYRARLPLACPVTAFGGSDDRHVTRKQIAAWEGETANRFSLRMFPGGHFFLDSERDALLAQLNADFEAPAFPQPGQDHELSAT